MADQKLKKKMQDGPAKAKQKMLDGRQKMQDGRAKKCKMVEQKLN
jgi:hypothetical protein